MRNLFYLVLVLIAWGLDSLRRVALRATPCLVVLGLGLAFVEFSYGCPRSQAAAGAAAGTNVNVNVDGRVAVNAQANGAAANLAIAGQRGSPLLAGLQQFRTNRALANAHAAGRLAARRGGSSATAVAGGGGSASASAGTQPANVNPLPPAGAKAPVSATATVDEAPQRTLLSPKAATPPAGKAKASASAESGT